MPTLVPFLIFSLFCVFIVALLLILFKIGAYFGKSDADEFRAVSVSTVPNPTETRKKQALSEISSNMRCDAHVAGTSHGTCPRNKPIYTPQ